MELVSPTQSSTQDDAVRRLLNERPEIAHSIMLLLNDYHEIALLGLNGADPADVLRELENCNNRRTRWGIPSLNIPEG